MFGKFFASAFTGSMVGSGLNVFAVWGYVIANARTDGTVELNPPILAAILGCSAGEVTAAIEILSSPDPASRSQKHDGRRLIQVAAFLYEVPTYADYRAIRDDDSRRDYMRKYMQEYRSKPVLTVNVNSCKPQLAHAEAEAEADTARAKEPEHVQQAARITKFEQFWQLYPEKKGKAAAAKAWSTKKCNEIAPLIMAHVRLMLAEDDDWRRGFAPNGSTYVNGERWTDQPKRARLPDKPAAGKRAQAITNLQEMRNGLVSGRDSGGFPALGVSGPGAPAGGGGDSGHGAGMG